MKNIEMSCSGSRGSTDCRDKVSVVSVPDRVYHYDNNFKI